VKLEHLSRRQAGTLVQAVDVLGEDAHGHARAVQPRQRPMGHVRRGVPGRMIEVRAPEAPPGRRIAQEAVIGERRLGGGIACPDTVRTPVVREPIEARATNAAARTIIGRPSVY
jgi:hypothetical protein